MKKIILSLLAALSISSLHANDFPLEEICEMNVCNPGRPFRPFFNENLRNIIAPNVKPLSRLTVQSGAPIAAFKTFVGFQDGPNFLHKGFYLNGIITTFLGSLKNSTPEIGEQMIRFYAGDGFECGRCLSTCWSTEFIGGKEYVVHYYNEFKVYTNSESQFVIGY